MKNSIFFFFSLVLFLGACEEEPSLERIDALTVEAYLHAGLPLDSLQFELVIPLDSLEAMPPPDDLLPVITTEAGETYPLAYLGSPGRYGNPELIIQENTIYTLEVAYQDQMISATTYIPLQPEGLLLSDTLVQKEKILSFEDLQNQTVPDPLELYWEAAPGAYYFVHVKNIEEQPEPINELFSGEGGFERPDFLTEPSQNHFYTIDTFRDLSHYGTYCVTVYRVNPEYVALYEDNTNGTGSLNEIRTNVQNGYGIFTGVNSKVVYFEVEKP